MVESSGHCPHLGLKQNRAIRFASPTPEHRCFVTGEAQEIPVDQVDQATFCLSQGHVRCPLYMGLPLPSTPTLEKVPLPLPLRVLRAWLASLSPRDRKIYKLLVGLLMIIVSVYAFIGAQLALNGIVNRPTTVIVVTSTPAPTLEPPPSSTPLPPTLTPTLTITPTLVPPTIITVTVEVPFPVTIEIPSPVVMPSVLSDTPTIATPIPPFFSPTPSPSETPTLTATETPTAEPTVEPTAEPTVEPTAEPTVEPTTEPTAEPTTEPTAEPTVEPTVEPPTVEPTVEPTTEPTTEPPTAEPPTSEPPTDVIILPSPSVEVRPTAETPSPSVFSSLAAKSARSFNAACSMPLAQRTALSS